MWVHALNIFFLPPRVRDGAKKAFRTVIEVAKNPIEIKTIPGRFVQKTTVEGVKEFKVF